MRITTIDAALDYATQQREDERGVRQFVHPELAPFAMFSLSLGDAHDPQTREPLFPNDRKHTPLWDVTPVGVDHATLEREIQQAEQYARDEKIEEMAANVENGLGVDGTPPEENGDDTPIDEWAYFWGGTSPTERGRCPRSAFATRQGRVSHHTGE